MKFLTAVLALVVLILLLGPIVGVAMAVAIPLGTFLIWFLPILIIACSGSHDRRGEGGVDPCDRVPVLVRVDLLLPPRAHQRAPR